MATDEALDIALMAKLWHRSPSSYLPNLDPIVALELDRALALRVLHWQADQQRRAGRGDVPGVEYEHIDGRVDPAVTAEIEGWHAERLRAEGRLH